MQKQNFVIKKTELESEEPESQSPVKFFLFVFAIPFLVLIIVAGLLNAHC